MHKTNLVITPLAGIGDLTACIGLIVIFPWVGHATQD